MVSKTKKGVPTSTHSDDRTIFMQRKLKRRRKFRPESGSQIALEKDSVISFSDSVNKIIMANQPRRSVRRLIRMPLMVPKKLPSTPPKVQVESHYKSLKKDPFFLPKSESVSKTLHKVTSDPGVVTRKSTIKYLSESYLSKPKARSSKVVVQEKTETSETKNVPGKKADIPLTFNPQNQSHIRIVDQFSHRNITANEKGKLSQPFELNYEALPGNLDHGLMTPDDRYLGDFEGARFEIKDLVSDSKYEPLQMFLKDVIEHNHILEYVADIKGLMQAVGSHPMWANLGALHLELLESGFSQEEAKQILTAKYLDYLKVIVSDMHFARIELPRDSLTNTDTSKTKQISQVDSLFEGGFKSRHRQSTPLFSFGLRGLESSFSLNSIDDLELIAEQNMFDIERRYSLDNIRSMMLEHHMMFLAIEKKRKIAEVDYKKMEGKLQKMYSTQQFRRPVEKSTSFTAKKRRNIRPVEQLYYSPRKTCRLQKICSECSECESVEKEIGDSMVLKKCPRCGVEVPVPAQTRSFIISPSSSGEIYVLAVAMSMRKSILAPSHH
ncbi:uncharacterized protein LOC108111907 [Drosophila eugracilis]|uniref:uncharacterized protein LOC108111907 n=1 Tax=Drosophila eugracilis TaxID=29029 RepID=UPI0007E8676F|nr:uncharacterized protein LOC108111907 [Drosophila eugracilis]